MSGSEDNNTITFQIDGRAITCDAGMTILDAARVNGIDIPNLCAHPTLKPFGRCRLCVVEVEGLRGYPSACTTPAANGMVVTTETEALSNLRRDALELVLTEHPTGCLICDHQDDCIETHGCHARRSATVTGCRFCPNDGQCELQDMVKRLGLEDMTFPVRYRGLPVDRRDPFFDRDYNLCILCARCVRACVERRGAGAISLTFRGGNALVGTAYNRPLIETACQFCGVCVDVCPTGALSERVNKWVGVPEAEVETTCPFGPLGCQLTLHTLDGQVIGARPVEGEELCSKGRFAVVETALAEERVLTCRRRREDRLVEVGWSSALDRAAEGLEAASSVAVYASAGLLNEDLEAIRDLAVETLGTRHLDTDAGLLDGDLPENVATLDEVRQAGVVLTVRADLRYTHTPVLLAIHGAVEAGAALVAIDPFRSDLKRHARVWLDPSPGDEEAVLTAILAAVEGVAAEDPSVAAAAELLASDGPKVVIWDSPLSQVSSGRAVAALQRLADVCGAKVLPLPISPNIRGVKQLGIEPQPGGAPLSRWFADGVDIKALVTFGRPPFSTRPDGVFWVAWSDVLDELIEQADVILPATVFTEQSGTMLNLFGAERVFRPAVDPAGDARSARDVCAALAERLPARSPLAAVETVEEPVDDPPAELDDGLLLVREYSRFSYLGSPLTQRVPGITPLASDGLLRMHPVDASEAELRDGDRVTISSASGSIEATLRVTTTTSPGTLRLVVPPAD